ncbi:nef-associated protein 1, partial [Asbolus verrucosus]
MSYFSREDEQSRIHYLEIQLGLARQCNKIKEELGNCRCVGCRNNQESEVEGAVGNAIAAVPVKYIGTINTDFPEKRATPRQPVICSDLIAKLTLNNEVFTNPNHALEGLQEFSHIWILAKVSPPRLNGARTGVLATRSPHRPNPIGLSLVKINKIVGNNIYFSGVDMIDGTPVVDIKPYIPHYDNPVMINLLEPNCT